MSSPVSSVLPELPERSGAAVTGRWRAPRRLAAQALALQGLGLGLTLVAALVASHLQHRTRLADFNGHTRVLSISLQDHLEMAQRDLERLRDLHYRIDLGRDELEIAGEAILRDSPWIRLFSWLPRVTQAQRNAFEEHRDGLDGQSIRQLDADGLVRPAARRAEHFPVADTVPASGLEALEGIDEGVDPVRAPALHQALASGRVIASPPFSSLSRTASEACASVLYAPVMERAWTLAEDYRPERTRGLVSATLDLGWMLQHVQAQAGIDGTEMLLLDPRQEAPVLVRLDDSRLVRAHSGDEAQALLASMRSGPHAVQSLQLGGREWQLLARPGWAGRAWQPDALVLSVLACGLVFSALLGALLRSRQRRTAELQAAHDDLERLVAQRTAALEAGNRQLAAEVDERRRLEDDLRQASRQAHQASQAKTMFLANMSHEIRTPLNAVIGYTQILLEDRTLATPAQQRLQTILQAGQRLLRLINDVLDLSKIEAGGLQLHAAPFDLRQEIDEIARLFAERAGARGLTLDCSIDLDAHEPVRGDRTKIGQIVMNLLGNAVKFTEQGRIGLEVSREGDQVQIRVSDSGPGIAPEELAQLFAPFRQGRAGIDKGGTGLGLVLARHMATAMGGGLEISSRPGQGTQARLSLPLPRQAHEVAASPVPAGTLPGHERLDPATPVHAVVVEDDEHSRDILVHLLERLGCRVEAAHDGLQGLRLIGQTRPDIVFTDIRMPVLDGLRMLAQLHASAATLQQAVPPVVAVSASSLEHERRHYIEQGFSDFVGKPYAFDEIHRMLAQHAGARFIAASPEPEPGHAATPIPAPCPPAPAAALETDALALLEALRQAALDGQMRAVRHALDRIDAAAPLPAATRERLRRAAQDYAFDDLARQVDALLRPGAASTAAQKPHTP
ncbi:hypothetical protein X805_00330 [Sphaerotilus natans subsp. natans DSM 6575]|uniref:histidine kinase n=1 Tax=Sphaerotilus natans subsp. natans DSM 6575 TaxID=1286631 RepID=A0A059KTE2_9BURK|nr:ATP-binding protein [Sphaerotilus natans]KDB54388.1 hypothetical protein X805_00330 [Sphaerotilus natans subsp. natans DSM 6575]SIR94895.1 Signal transduction histidine kinase [Sphaerotilus natans]